MEIYGSKVFNEHVMKERLPSATYKSLEKTLHRGAPLDIEVANVVASVMKRWAMELGATHYTHWFQPLTGITSEKHDGFVSPVGDGTAIMEFNGKELVRGEPDASSFPPAVCAPPARPAATPHGTPPAYAFVKDDVLCIPTAFVSYTGEALDKKTPLLRSMNALSNQAIRVLKLFGKDVDYVSTTVGPEQEYFLIKKEDYEARQDLILTGRTLFGAPSAKGQELEEHYFGVIRPEVSEFMKELDEELWKLGIPAKTKHNEVAPCQHELAPIFDTTNVAIDHNLLTMEMMKKLAPSTVWSACSMRSLSRASTAAASTTTGPCPPPTKNCSTRATPPWRTCSSWCSWLLSSRLLTSTPICCAPPLPPPATITVWAPTRRLRLSFPSSWAKSWKLSSTLSHPIPPTPAPSR